MTSPVEPVEPVETLTDAEVPAWWAGLDLPGLLDVHVHFLPPRVMSKVLAQFDAAGPLIGRPWPVAYRGTDEQRVQTLRALGVRRFSALPYAHRPGIAEYLNDWAADFARDVPEAWTCATFYPESQARAYVDRRIPDTDLWKVHVQVGDFDLADPLLDDVWGALEDAGSPVVVHAGSGPVPNSHTGPGPLRAVLGRFPRLTVVVAHMGAPEYREFTSIAEDFERVHLDTTMAFTEFFERAGARYPEDLFPRLRALSDRVLLGTDFPNIPYPYAHQLEALERLADRAGLDEDWLRAVCWHNPARLLGV